MHCMSANRDSSLQKHMYFCKFLAHYYTGQSCPSGLLWQLSHNLTCTGNIHLHHSTVHPSCPTVSLMVEDFCYHRRGRSREQRQHGAGSTISASLRGRAAGRWVGGEKSVWKQCLIQGPSKHCRELDWETHPSLPLKPHLQQQACRPEGSGMLQWCKKTPVNQAFCNWQNCLSKRREKVNISR